MKVASNCGRYFFTDFRLDPAKIEGFTLVGAAGQRLPLSQNGEVDVRMENPTLPTGTVLRRSGAFESFRKQSHRLEFMLPLACSARPILFAAAIVTDSPLRSSSSAEHLTAGAAMLMAPTG